MDPDEERIFGKSATRLQYALRQYRKQYNVENMKLHDVRRSLRTFAASRSMDRAASEAALDHAVIKDPLEAAYNHHDYTADGHGVIMAWQLHILGLIKPSDNVIKLGA